MNTPGTTEGNWQWRFRHDQVPGSLQRRIHEMLEFYDRLPV